MKLIIANTNATMSKQVADEITHIMQSRKEPLICTASGDSPAGLYREIVDRVHHQQLDVSRWFFVGLDEWVPMNGNDEGSCRYHLNQQLFNPLQIAGDRICFFDGRANDLSKECTKTEQFVERHGGIDVAILGLGMNGHIGMNEPGTSAELHSHVVDLDPLTQQVGQKYFTKQQKLSKGITLGIATLMEARNIVLLISGKHKAGIARAIIEEDISEKLPGTLLRHHPSLKIYLDEEAAAEIVIG